jgi:hypothetical protein
MKTNLILLWGIVLGLLSASLAAQDEIVFRPYDPSAPQARVGGSIRGADSELSIAVLAPGQIAVTTQASPALYWFASAPVSNPVELVLIREGGEEPLVEVVLEPPLLAGIHAFQIPATTRLENGLTYQWSIAVMPNPDSRSKDIFASALMTRVGEPAGLSNIKGHQDRATWLASNGIWYDAITELSNTINDKDDRDPRARSLRAQLLQQVGLTTIAQYELQEIKP